MAVVVRQQGERLAWKLFTSRMIGVAKIEKLVVYEYSKVEASW